MGMNFFALHTYPEGGVGPEPTTWIGPKGRFSKINLEHINRGVYSVTLPREKTMDDFEYYIEIITDENQTLKFPSTTPDINQSVVVQSI